MQTTKIVEAYFNGTREAKTRSLYQYDYGQILTFPDLETPLTYQVQFCGLGDTTTVEAIGTPDGVAIPDAVLETGKYINAYIFLHDGATDGETRYNIIIPVTRRPEMSDITPTPAEQSEIDQLIIALNDGVDRAETAATNAEASETAAATSESNAEAWAVGQRDGVDVQPGDVTYDNNAKSWAGKAAQSAAQAGYMFFYIDDNGDLIYQHTDNVDVDFYLDNGDLYVRATA